MFTTFYNQKYTLASNSLTSLAPKISNTKGGIPPLPTNSLNKNTQVQNITSFEICEIRDPCLTFLFQSIHIYIYLHLQCYLIALLAYITFILEYLINQETELTEAITGYKSGQPCNIRKS